MANEIPLLEANNVGRRSREGDAWLFRNSSLTVSSGDRIALTGPTGAGKTVLLRSLAMLDPIDEGMIQWQGTQPALDRIPAFRSQAIYLPQRASLLDGTVEQNLRLPCSLQVNRDHKFSREWIVTQLSLLNRDEDFLNRDSADLSGGERQIVALLRAIQLAPSLLLLDEPTASLDDATSRQVENLVWDWLKQGELHRAYLWVTHDSAQADRVANKKFRIAAGSLSEQAGLP